MNSMLAAFVGMFRVELSASIFLNTVDGLVVEFLAEKLEPYLKLMIENKGDVKPAFF